MTAAWWGFGPIEGTILTPFQKDSQDMAKFLMTLQIETVPGMKIPALDQFERDVQEYMTKRLVEDEVLNTEEAQVTHVYNLQLMPEDYIRDFLVETGKVVA